MTQCACALSLSGSSSLRPSAAHICTSVIIAFARHHHPTPTQPTHTHTHPCSASARIRTKHAHYFGRRAGEHQMPIIVPGPVLDALRVAPAQTDLNVSHIAQSPRARDGFVSLCADSSSAARLCVLHSAGGVTRGLALGGNGSGVMVSWRGFVRQQQSQCPARIPARMSATDGGGDVIHSVILRSRVCARARDARSSLLSACPPRPPPHRPEVHMI